MIEDTKKYKSYHDIPPREYMYFPKGTIELGETGQFSRLEIKHLLISIFVLTFAFSFALTDNNMIQAYYSGFKFNNLILGIEKSFLGVIIAFFCHEISHKFVAQKYHLWSEYRMYSKGLILAIILGFFTPIVFAVPGAVMFRGKVRLFEMGKIALAGPLSNLLISIITFYLYLFVFFESTLLNDIFGFICLINAVLATFNLIPFQSFDGYKIFIWNKNIWLISLVSSSIVLFNIIIRFNY
ncbi:MAG: site-2 protease family protein [Candidatus Thermoplasmatota archaeon]|nr:site-2 protease family protein [Candidatus Thermoplasmatota archaeon]